MARPGPVLPGRGSRRATAQETGSISGYTFDAAGTAVAGVTVTVTGAQLPGARSVTTSDNGFFQVPILLPGSYTVKASKTGVGDSQRTVVVEVARDSQVDLALGVTLQESVAVTAATPRVDLRSTEVNFNFSKALIDQLPLQRTYAGLFQLVPGVAENNSFAPNGGGSRQDNTYLLDGVNITNPGFGYLSTEVNEFDIQEFSVKRGAITAEFGRASGFVTNAVTRSGSNTLSGGARLEVIPSAWIQDSDKRIRSTTSRLVPSIALGGPIRHDKVFFYASAQTTRIDTTERSNNLGAVPDREQRTFDYFGKVTAAPANNHFLSASYRSRPNTDDFAGVGVNDSAAVATNTEGTNRVATATYSWFFSSTGYLDVKYLRLDEENETVAVTDLGFQPAFNINNLPGMGLFTTNGVNVGGASLNLNRQNYARDEIKATVSQYLDVKGMSHQIKAGFGVEGTKEDLTRISNGWGALSIVQAGRQIQARYYPRQPSQLSKSRTYSLFFQDNITLGPAPGGQRGRAVEPGRLPAGAGVDEHVPDLRHGQPDPAAPRRQLQPAQGRRRQDLRQLRALLQLGPEEQRALARPQPAVHQRRPLRRRHRGVDLGHHRRQHHRQGAARPRSDLHRRSHRRLRHAAAAGLERRRVLPLPHARRTSSRISRRCCRRARSSSTTSRTRSASTAPSPSNCRGRSATSGA